MASITLKNIAIKGISAAVPSHLVKTTDFDFFNESDAENFIKTVGIKERYMADDKTCASDLCTAAAEQLLMDLNWDKEEIGFLAFESVTADYRTPPTSCIIQDRLSLPHSCYTLDLPMGCCGFIYVLSVVGSLMMASPSKKGLLLVGDTITRMSSPYDKSRVPLFGDCGTAIALEYDENASDIYIDMETYGEGHSALITPHSGFRHQVTPESFIYEDFGNGVKRAPVHSVIEGMNVFAFAITKPIKALDRFLKNNNIGKNNDVDYFLIHQANQMIVDRVIKKSHIDASKAPLNLDRFANLGGASIPMLMATSISDDLRNRPQKLLMSAFGLGLTCGTAYLETQPMVISNLIKI